VTPTEVRAGRVAWLSAAAVVRLRFVLVAAWIAATFYVVAIDPVPPADPAGDVVSLVPANSRAIAAERRAAERFRIPISTHTAVVQREPDGISERGQRTIVGAAVENDRRAARDPEARNVFFALPVINSAGLVPASREANTTAVTWLAFSEISAFLDRDRVAGEYADRLERVSGTEAKVTGIVPAQLEEGRIIEDALIWVEIATVALIALLVGLKFRSVVAPLVTLATVAVAYLVSAWVLDKAGEVFDVSIPTVLQPLLVALILGIVTDYSVFYMSSFRRHLHAGESRLDAARTTTAGLSPIVLAGGLILAAGLLALLGASVSFFRTLGPGLALTVLVSLIVGLTLIPSLLAMFGSWVYWPARPKPDPAAAATGSRRVAIRQRVARLQSSRPVALLTVAACVAGLGFAAAQVLDARLGFTNISGLPADAEEREAAEAAAEGFAAGIISPTQVVVEAPGIAARTDELVALQERLAAVDGVAAVVGPREQVVDDPPVAFSEDGDAARYLLVLDDEPLSAGAISTLGTIADDVEAMARDAGLDGARVSLSGDTAVAEETVTTFRGDLLKIFGLVLFVNLVALAIFLRAIVAPLYLVGASVLGVAATFGLTTWVFQDVLGYGQLTYYMPFAVAVLLISLGSDYNVFVVGRVWQEARVRPLREALMVAAPRAASAIRAAGVTLALSFAVLAIIELHAFWEFAFAMTVGILLETFVVRSLLVPALVALFGYVSAWPGGGLRLHSEYRGARRASTTEA
jgi:RND superfamily putative drug exporter